jgi:putative endonuclease
MVEAAARRHLLAAGLTDVASNASYRGGELDLVMLDRDGRAGNCLVFVEVRYRSVAAFGGGLMSIDARKRRKLVHAAQLFLASHRQFALSACRFDVVVADGDVAAPNITWLRDAFRADDPA